MLDFSFTDREWYFSFFEENPTACAKVALDGKFIKVNNAYALLTGYSVSELEGKTFQSITHPDDLIGDQEMVNELMNVNRTRLSYTMIKRYITKHGKSVWVQLWVRVIRDEKGNALCFYAQADALPNHGHFKVEEVKKELIIRPAVKLHEFIRDNWQWFIGIFGTAAFFIAKFSFKFIEIMQKLEIGW